MYLDFPIGFPIMKFDFSDFPALVGAFAMGPVWGVVITLVKNLLICLLKGTESAYVGQLANFIVGAALVYPAGLVYKYNKTKGGAMLGLAAGAVSILVFSALANYYIMIPFYIKFMKIPLDGIIAKCNTPLVTNLWTYILYIVLPFNAIKAVVVSILTMLLYKRISPLLHGRDLS